MHPTAAPDLTQALAHYSAMAAEATAAQLTRHTSGPWVWVGASLRPADPQPQEQHVHTILERDGGSGFLGSDWRATEHELDADMLLIAAAPLLLEALQSCAMRLEALAPTSTAYTLAKARVAIAAATGAQA